MNEQKHTIGRHVLELTVSDREQALLIQNDTSKLVKGKLIPALDQLFNNLTTGDEVLRIDRLVLDLGDVSISSFEEDLVSKTINELEQQLTEVIHSQKTQQATPPGFSAEDNARVFFTSKLESHLEQFVHYLKYGVLPWWREAGAEKKTGLNELLQVVGKENKESIAEVILPLIRIGQVRQRIAYQLDATQFFKFISLLAVKFGQQTEKNIKKLVSGKLAGYWEMGPALRYHLLEMIVGGRELSNEDSIVELALRIIRDGLKGRSLKNQTIFLAVFIRHLDKLPLNIELKQKIFSFIIQTAKERKILFKETEQRILAKSVKPTGETLIKRKKDQQPKPAIEEEKSKTEPTSLKQDLSDKETPDIEDKEFAEPAVGIESSIEEKEDLSKPTYFKEEPETPDSSIPVGETNTELDQKKFRLAIDQQEVWVDNAGLVLLNPFLFFFFDGLGLLNKEKNFKSDQHAFRAVHLLQYLATGDSASPEHELSLNKILCGIDLNDPIPYDLRLTKKEKEESSHLITVVLERWGALKTKDAEALRNGFLRREGRLSFQGKGWNLFIERTTLDVLLDRLPWSLSMVKFPWRDDIIYVEW